LQIEASDTTLTSGDALNFDLHLRNPQGEETGVTAAIMVAFKVSNDAKDFVPDAPLNTPLPDGNGNTVVWTYNEKTGDYTLTATLAPNSSVLHIEFDAQHTQDQPGFVDAHQTINLQLQGVTDTDGHALPGLDPKIHTGDAAHPLQAGGHVEFTVVDSDYAQIAPFGISIDEAVGKEVVQLGDAHVQGDGSLFHDGSGADHGQGQIIMGGEGDNTIYASQGNDILVGGGGNDTFVWNNLNMGQNEHSTDIIKDFSQGDSLHFADLLAEHGDGAQTALADMINSGEWQANDQGAGGTFMATAECGSSIQLSVADTVATLTVSYQQDGQNYTQNVELQNFDAGQFAAEGADQAASVQQMLHEIIKVGGNT
jgi:Ca2+-binding RTX toxin-like protein